MSAYSWGVAISRRSDAIQEGWCNDLKIWWNTHKDSLILLIASTIAFSSAITDIAVNWQKNVIWHCTLHYAYIVILICIGMDCASLQR